MNTPLCTICLKNYPLICGNCQEKIEKGEITELAVRVARILINLEDRFPVLKDVNFRRAFQVGNLIIILVGRGDVRRILSQHRQIIRPLQNELQQNIRFVEESRNPQHLLKDLLRPVRILGVNTIWLPDNTFERKVRISTRDRERVPLSLEQLETTIYELSGERIRITFD